MFDHLLFILDNANILLSRPSLRGSTPLDVRPPPLHPGQRQHPLVPTKSAGIHPSRCSTTSSSSWTTPTSSCPDQVCGDPPLSMFDHLLFILDNANILLSRPSLRGST